MFGRPSQKKKPLHQLRSAFSGPQTVGQRLRIRWRLLRSRLFWSLFALLILVAGGVSMAVVIKDLPSPTKLTHSDNFAVGTQIFDRNGELLYEIYADENRIPIQISEIPPHVYQASIAIEDQHFYQHFGFDILGILRAAINNARGESLEGGSTITQQLVKNALLTRERSIQRKIREALLAVATEVLYTKEAILELYLNYISYGGTAVGIESAAQYYFDVPASELTLAQAALLAGLPKAPSLYSPFGSTPERAKERQQEVLRRMVEDGYITQEEADEAAAEVLEFALTKHDIKAPHFVFYVRDLLYEEYGTEMVERGGLRVTTSLDLGLQEVAQASVSAELEQLNRHNVGNGAALIMKPNTGEILAMVGSRDYFDTASDGQVNVTLAERQPGSSIKPIMYATAFQEKTLNPGTILLDVPTCFEIPGQKDYCPKNYDGSYKGPVTVRTALGNSLNIPAVKALKTVGVTKFMSQARAMGIENWTDPSRYGLSLTLGGGEVRMIDLAQAFAVLANQGVKVPISPILEITDYRGTEIYRLDLEERARELEYLTFNYAEQGEGQLTRVMDRGPAYLASHIMQDNKARSAVFGPRSELVIPDQIVSAKTGTTNNLKDNWTVGFTPEFLAITWVGNNDSSPMNHRVVSGVTGASPIWNDLMSWVLKDQEPIWQELPPEVRSAEVCASGFPPDKEAGDDCRVRETELFWELSQPSQSKMKTADYWIDPNTGQPPPEGQHVDGLEIQQRTIYTDPLTNEYCPNCVLGANTGAGAENPDGQPEQPSWRSTRVLDSPPEDNPDDG